MLRRIMIISAAAVAALALAAAPAGAGAGNLHLYTAPNRGGTHVSVPESTVGGYQNQCVSVLTLTSSGITSAQSVDNNTSYTLDLHTASNCAATSYITTVSPNSYWTTSSSETVLYIRVT